MGSIRSFGAERAFLSARESARTYYEMSYICAAVARGAIIMEIARALPAEALHYINFQ